MEKVHVIVNPFSARGKTEQRWENMRSAIKYYYKEFKYIFTEKPNQATEIARELLHDGFNLIIGIGGDGTLNEITNGFFSEKSRSVINEDASLGIIPSGTGSDFIRFLKIPRDFRKSVELIKNSNRKKIDVGKITYLDPSGTRCPEGAKNHKYFINIADFGLGADVVKNLEEIPSSKRGPLSYYSGLLTTIKKYKSKNVRIIIDGKRELTGKYLIGAIANGGIFGGGMIIAPKAKVDDGFFDLVLIKDMKKLEIIGNSLHLYRGTIENSPKVEIIRAKKIDIFSDEEVKVEYDGEIGKTLPASFEIVERSIKFRA